MNNVDNVNFDNIRKKNKYPKVNYMQCIENSQRDYVKFFIEKIIIHTENDLIIIVVISLIQIIRLIKGFILFILLKIKKSIIFVE